jgi:hypothetical protein
MNTDSPTATLFVIPPIPSPFTTVDGAVLWAQILSPGLFEGPSRKSEKLKKSVAEEAEREKELKQSHIKLYYRGMYDQVIGNKMLFLTYNCLI